MFKSKISNLLFVPPKAELFSEECHSFRQLRLTRYTSVEHLLQKLTGSFMELPDFKPRQSQIQASETKRFSIRPISLVTPNATTNSVVQKNLLKDVFKERIIRYNGYERQKEEVLLKLHQKLSSQLENQSSRLNQMQKSTTKIDKLLDEVFVEDNSIKKEEISRLSYIQNTILQPVANRYSKTPKSKLGTIYDKNKYQNFYDNMHQTKKTLVSPKASRTYMIEQDLQGIMSPRQIQGFRSYAFKNGGRIPSFLKI